MHTSSDGLRSEVLGLLFAGAAAVALALVAYLDGGRAVEACGPTFPNRLLLGADEQLTRAPVGELAVELRRLVPESAPPYAAHPPAAGQSRSELTAEADVRELADALAARGTPRDVTARVVAEYRAVRDVLKKHVLGIGDAGAWPRDGLDGLRVPDGLPSEFADYLEGALAFRRLDGSAARAAWQRLLARPADERRHRSVWAAYMLGRSFVEEGPGAVDDARRWFAETRALAAAGFADATGLAAASHAMEGRALYAAERYVEALPLYLAAWHAGDPDAGPSLRFTARRVAARPEALAAAARDPLTRRVMTAHFVTTSGWEWAGDEQVASQVRWLEAVDAAEPVGDVEGADRLAWLAYQAGDLARTRRWLAKAAPDSAVTAWIRAKLHLRGGRTSAAARELAKAARAMPLDETWSDLLSGYEHEDSFVFVPKRRIDGELGVLKLARGQFVEALDLLLRAGYWRDAAYIGERVLTTAELRAYVDRVWPTPANAVPTAPDPPELEDGFAPVRRPDIRYLLGRRLAREGRLAEALPYLPAEWQPKLAAYATGLAVGRDTKQPKDKRARALVEAARLARHDGIDLLGTELAPDYAAEDGQFADPDVGALRIAPKTRPRLAAPTSAERTRLRRHRLRPEKRFHYRYVAADIAWEAALLLPDRSDELARLLVEAGSWLKFRDPKAAYRFYRALVRRCPDTSLGEWGASKGWLPAPDAAPDVPPAP